MTTKKLNQRKARAILAGGLVLGVGAAVTLAAWNDSEFATGDFAAGSFNLEGSTTGADSGFADHAAADGAAALEFTLPLADNLSPDDVVHAPFWVRLDDSTTTPATLTAAGVDANGANAVNLSYTVSALDATETCGDDAGTLVASGTSLSDFTAGTGVALAIGAGVDAGEAVQLCFEVTAGADLEQGAAASATWQFTATSE